MKGRSRPVRDIKDSYKIRKAVMNGIPMADVDAVEGGFAWAALLPILKAVGLPILGAAGTWIKDKIFNRRKAPPPVATTATPGAPPQGTGILRAGDRRGKGILQAGASRGGAHIVSMDPADIPIKIPQHSRKYHTTRAGDLPLPTRYVIQGAGIDVERLKAKLIPFIKANDPVGFKNKILKTIKKKIPG